MKTLYLIVLASFSFCSSFAQGSAYYNVKDYLLGKGFTISKDIYGDIAQGETVYYWKTFYKDITYVIYGFSDDNNVNDLDIYVYYEDGDLYTHDAESDATPIVTFTPSYTRTMKVVLKNYDSDTPYNESRCRFFIVYK